ncbi:MAG TPA: hypothetical protein DEQ64_01665 [Lachnoclostridium sp.]|jgi:hypothetical protein|nr:hypothetical protein [Lachnoclostridium sp.]
MATESTLNEALAELSRVLNALDYQVIVNNVNITTKELAG